MLGDLKEILKSCQGNPPSLFSCFFLPPITITNGKPHMGSDGNCKSARCSKSSLHFLQKFRGNHTVRFWGNQETSTLWVKHPNPFKRHHPERGFLLVRYQNSYRGACGDVKMDHEIPNIQAEMKNCQGFGMFLIFETNPYTCR